MPEKSNDVLINEMLVGDILRTTDGSFYLEFNSNGFFLKRPDGKTHHFYKKRNHMLKYVSINLPEKTFVKVSPKYDTISDVTDSVDSTDFLPSLRVSPTLITEDDSFAIHVGNIKHVVASTMRKITMVLWESVSKRQV